MADPYGMQITGFLMLFKPAPFVVCRYLLELSRSLLFLPTREFDKEY
jgi:hypothetical protein